MQMWSFPRIEEQSYSLKSSHIYLHMLNCDHHDGHADEHNARRM